jgi:hypothetical protein
VTGLTAPHDAYDLAAMNSGALERLLASHGGAVSLYLGGSMKGSIGEPDLVAWPLSFALVLVDRQLLERVAKHEKNHRKYLVQMAERTAHITKPDTDSDLHVSQPLGKSAKSRATVTSLPDDGEHRWTLQVDENGFRMMADVDGATMNDARTVVYRSLKVDTSALLRLLASSAEARAENLQALAPHTRMLGSHIFLSESELSFVDDVALLVPEVRAELTAAAMRDMVSGRLAACHDDALSAALSAAPSTAISAPRRRRMSV